jgi:hypothetical protein
MTVMHVVVVTEYGSGAQPTDMPGRDRRAGHVLIKVIAAGPNPIDRVNTHRCGAQRSDRRATSFHDPASGSRPAGAARRPLGGRHGDVLRDRREMP